MADTNKDSSTFNENEQNDQTKPTNQVEETSTKESNATPPTDQQVEYGTEADEQTETIEEIVPFTQSEWTNKKAVLKQQFPELTEEDLTYEEGKHTELYDRVQTRLDKTNYEVKNLIADIK